MGIDSDERAIMAVRAQAGRLAPSLPESNFRAEKLESTTFPDGVADVVISSAVLHFATDEQHFADMGRGTWRLLRDNGLFFCRLASSIGMPDRFRPLGSGRYLLPDNSKRFLVDEAMLLEWTATLSGTLLDPIKTTVVQDSRCMTTWVLRKRAPTTSHIAPRV